ncbi:MAG TPA: hypothetical protein VGN57_19020 [Pirellulaceae bacterium]|jgi:hypothetical protein|nr:hypothetical protein [Pirellulaceae bacterium]
MKTFVYTGPEKRLFIAGLTLEQNEPYHTDDPKLIRQMTLAGLAKEDKEKKKSRDSDAEQS